MDDDDDDDDAVPSSLFAAVCAIVESAGITCFAERAGVALRVLLTVYNGSLSGDKTLSHRVLIVCRGSLPGSISVPLSLEDFKLEDSKTGRVHQNYV